MAQNLDAHVAKITKKIKNRKLKLVKFNFKVPARFQAMEQLIPQVDNLTLENCKITRSKLKVLTMNLTHLALTLPDFHLTKTPVQLISLSLTQV
jgi:hypothetical protein